jgi:hypothetical protein
MLSIPPDMLLTFGLTALSLLGSTLATSPSVGRALAKLDATNTITLAVGPSGSSGQKFEYTTDNGATWKAWTTKTGSREIGPLSSIGYRVKGKNSTAVIHQVRFLSVLVGTIFKLCVRRTRLRPTQM